MKPAPFRVLLLGLLLVGSGLACALTSSQQVADEPAQAEVSATEAGAGETATPTVDGSSDGGQAISGSINLDSLADVQFPFDVSSYHVTYRQSVVTEDDRGEESLEGDVSRDPPGSAMVRQQAGARTGDGTSVDDLRVIDGTGYLQNPDVCVMTDPTPMTLEPMPPTFYLPEPAEFLTGEAELIERGVMMNGRMTDHYGFDAANFKEGEFVAPKMESLDRGDVYFDSGHGFLVDLQFEGTGSNSDIMTFASDPELPGTVTYRLSFSDFDQPTDIQGFETCGPVPQTDYPVIDRPIIVYQRSSASLDLTVVGDLDEVVQYYKTALAEDGWTLVEERAFDPRDLSFTFEGQEGKTLEVGIRNDAPQSAAPEDGIITITFFELDFNF
jgi:hypothetical protein